MLWSILEKIIPSVTADEEPIEYESPDEFSDSKQSNSNNYKGNQEYDESESDYEEEPVKKPTSNPFRAPEREKPQLDFNMLKRQDSRKSGMNRENSSEQLDSSHDINRDYYNEQATFVYEKKENAFTDAEHKFHYKKNAQKSEQPTNFRVRRIQEKEEDMSMRADADRLSQALGDHDRYDAAHEELVASEEAEQARLEVLKKGKKLALQQMNRGNSYVGMRKESHKSYQKMFGAGGAGRVEKAVERHMRDSDRSSLSFATQSDMSTTRSSAGVSITTKEWMKLLEQEHPLSKS